MGGPIGSIDFRLQWWNQMWLDAMSDFKILLLGKGYGFPLIDFMITHGIEVREPHNDIVSILARSGLIGLFLVLWLHVVLIKNWLRNYNFAEFNHGMLGPVCFSREKDKFVIQGGFSIRDKQLMIELSSFRKKFIEKNLDMKIVEDIYFTKLIRQNYPNLFPSIKECDEFAIESWGDYKKAIGIHGTDKYYVRTDFYKEIFNYLELKKIF